MADLVTRLRLDNSQFDDNIRRSRAQIEGLQSSGNMAQRGLSSLLTSFKGMAAGIGIASAAMATFQTAINSNAVAQNAWKDAIGTAKESVDLFFTSLTTGDWSVFDKGITHAIKMSKEYTKTLRELKLGLKLTDVLLSVDEKEMNKYDNLASDESNTKSVREKAFADFKNTHKKAQDRMKQASGNAYNDLTTLLKDKGINGVGNADELRSLILEFQNPLLKENSFLQKYMNLKDDALKPLDREKRIELQKHRAGDTATSGNERVKKYQEQYKKEQEDINKLLKLYPQLEKARLIHINFGGEEEMESILDDLDKITGYEDRMETMNTQYRNLAKDFDKSGKLKPKDNKTNPKDKIKPKDLYDFQMDSWVNEELHGFHSKLKRAAYGLEPLPITYKPEIIEEEEPEDLPLPTFTANDVEINNQYAESLNGIASIMGSITNLTNEGAAAWISWTANILTSVAAAIPAIKAVTAAKKEESVANGVASATQTPFVGWMLAGAAVASVVAALAAIPSFNSGGIFESPLTTGDKNLARLNGGEMILNKSQQYNLFKLLDNGSPMANGGNVTFKIQGKELIGVLNNYNNKIRKVM